MLVKHTISAVKAWLGKTEGRNRVCREQILVGGKRRTRPRRLLSKGVRIYFHYLDGVRVREAWNANAGLERARAMKLVRGVKAIGTEEGAMTIHVKSPAFSASADGR